MSSETRQTTPAGGGLGVGYAVREELKRIQRQLPLPIQTVLLRATGDRYNPYSRENDLTESIFAHIPKTGGTSVATCVYGGWKRHYPLSHYAAFDPDRYRRYLKFAFVRNPWDRLLSAYSYLTGRGGPLEAPGERWARANLAHYPDFESFVLSLRDRRTRRRIVNYVGLRPQLSWLVLPGSSKVEVDFLGRFERLSEDYARLADRLGVTEPLPFKNASRHQSYKHAYSAEMRQIVAELYEADISAFGYEF